MPWKKLEFWFAIFLVVYLVTVGIGSAFLVILSFPEKEGVAFEFPMLVNDLLGQDETGIKAENGFILIAFVAGIAGSFLHAAQSLSSYIGNTTFMASWATWYFLRPWIGGVLGIAIYVVLRAGLVSGIDSVNAYGVVALGLLGGWFSKTTTDKLQEVFETLFKTDKDKSRRNKLEDLGQPVISEIDPASIPSVVNRIAVLGQNFLRGATVQIGDDEIPAEFISDSRLDVLSSRLPRRPVTNTLVLIQVKNPEGAKPISEGPEIEFLWQSLMLRDWFRSDLKKNHWRQCSIRANEEITRPMSDSVHCSICVKRTRFGMDSPIGHSAT